MCSLSFFLVEKAQQRMTKVMRKFYLRRHAQIGSGGAIVGTPEYEMIDKIRRMLLNGVAFLHEDLSPLVRNFIEELWNDNAVRILVVTDKVAANCPCRAEDMLITNCRRFSGQNYRFVNSKKKVNRHCFHSSYLTRYEYERLNCLSANSALPRRIVIFSDWVMNVNTFKGIVQASFALFSNFGSSHH